VPGKQPNARALLEQMQVCRLLVCQAGATGAGQQQWQLDPTQRRAHLLLKAAESASLVQAPPLHPPVKPAQTHTLLQTGENGIFVCTLRELDRVIHRHVPVACCLSPQTACNCIRTHTHKSWSHRDWAESPCCDLKHKSRGR